MTSKEFQMRFRDKMGMMTKHGIVSISSSEAVQLPVAILLKHDLGHKAAFRKLPGHSPDKSALKKSTGQEKKHRLLPALKVKHSLGTLGMRSHSSVPVMLENEGSFEEFTRLPRIDSKLNQTLIGEPWQLKKKSNKIRKLM